MRLQLAALANIGSIAQWTALESLRLFAPAAEPADDVQQAIAAASHLPRLHSLKLYGVELSTSSQQWAQLASMPALRSLNLRRLHVDSAAAPSISIKHLKATLALQLPAEQLDGGLAALLPALEQLDGNSLTSQQLEGATPTIQQVLLALHGHASLQELSHYATSISEAYWQQQLLRSMPRLRVLYLSRVAQPVGG